MTMHDEAWEQAAEEQIRAHRMGTLTVTLRDADHRVMPGLRVRLRQTESAFSWGTAVRAQYCADETAEPQYLRHLEEQFNCAVLDNDHKWPIWERAERRVYAEAAVAWLRARGKRLRGHTMLWQTKQFGLPMPGDVWAEVLKAEAGESADLAHVRARIAAHIAAAGAHSRGKVMAWDVTNEITEHHHALLALTPEQNPHTSSEIAEWYRLARQADPEAALFVNDYHILVGDFEEHKRGYEATIQSLLDAQAPLGGIGMQAHFHGADLQRSAAQIAATLDRFARFGLPIWITEFDTFGAWSDDQAEREAEQAAFMRRFMISCFAHPAVAGFMLWGFWDGSHWAKNGPLFRHDWSSKPGYEVWQELVFKRWRSEAELETDANGSASLRGFKGDYVLECEHDGTSWQLPVSLHGELAEHTVRLG
ncbi:MAG: endo-1,4-beta-xylanase [Planctomycetota bacterium]|jgi:endo-1,4-beta-xylanase|nr:endo-1,4-beta-xylanase [Planctomycetota bacterium]